MYVIPLVVFVVLGMVAVAWSPIFALLFFAIFLVGFFVFVGMSRRADQELAPPQMPGAENRTTHEDEDTGLWGERRP
jgi:Flp pilus assembly protein TadB